MHTSLIPRAVYDVIMHKRCCVSLLIHHSFLGLVLLLVVVLFVVDLAGEDCSDGVWFANFCIGVRLIPVLEEDFLDDDFLTDVGASTAALAGFSAMTTSSTIGRG